jgi:prepilin-type N-terminal cleavage/methylation domain-containing protein
MSRKQQLAGFSLVELLVVLGVLALLIAIFLPRLRGSRMTAQTAACLQRLHQNFTSVTMYAHASADAWPYALSRNYEDPYTGQQVRLHSPYVPFSYTWVGDYWHAPMLRDYFDGDGLSPALFCPASSHRAGLIAENTGRTRSWSSGISMSMALFLDPAVLDPDRPRWERSLFRGLRAGDVSFPSSKAALIDLLPWHDERNRPLGAIVRVPPWRLNVLACDGSGALRDHRSSKEGIVFSAARTTEGRPRLDGWTECYQFTPRGVNGVDW